MARTPGSRRFQRVRLTVRRRRADPEHRRGAGQEGRQGGPPRRAESQRRSASAPATPATSRTGPIRRPARYRGSTSTEGRRRRRGRRVVVVHLRVAGVAGRRAGRGPGAGGRPHRAAAPRRRHGRRSVASSKRVSGESEVVEPRAEPDHDRHRSVGHPTAAAHQPPARRAAPEHRQGAHRATAEVGPRHAGRDRGRLAAGSRVPRGADVQAVDAGGADLPRRRPRCRRVLRQGVREGLPAGGDPRHRRLRRGAGRGLLAG